MAVGKRNGIIAIWILLTLLLSTPGFINYYFYLTVPPINNSYVFLDETMIVEPDQVVVFNMTGRYRFVGFDRMIYCYYISVKAILGNFTIYETSKPINSSDQIEIGQMHSKISSEGREFESCIRGDPFLILHFATANMFRIRVTKIKVV